MHTIELHVDDCEFCEIPSNDKLVLMAKNGKQMVVVWKPKTEG